MLKAYSYDFLQIHTFDKKKYIFFAYTQKYTVLFILSDQVKRVKADYLMAYILFNTKFLRLIAFVRLSKFIYSFMRNLTGP